MRVVLNACRVKGEREDKERENKLDLKRCDQITDSQSLHTNAYTMQVLQTVESMFMRRAGLSIHDLGH